MNIHPGHNRLDRQLQLRPRDYAADPHRYGVDRRVTFDLPAGGTVQSLRAARVQHLLVVLWRDDASISGAELARRWDCSRQTVSKTTLGARWAGHVLQSALVEPLLMHHLRR